MEAEALASIYDDDFVHDGESFVVALRAVAHDKEASEVVDIDEGALVGVGVILPVCCVWGAQVCVCVCVCARMQLRQ